MRNRLDLSKIAKASGRKRRAVIRPIEATKALENEARLLVRGIPGRWAIEVNENILPAYLPAKELMVRDDAADLLRTAIAATNDHLGYYVEAISPSLRRWLDRLELWHRTRFGAVVKAGVGVDPGPFLSADDVSRELGAALDRYMSLVSGLSDQIKKDVGRIIWDGMSQGWGRGEVAKQLTERFDIGRGRADLIARDQTANITGRLTRIRHEQVGGDSYEWSTSHDERVRPEHRARDGKTFKWKNPPADGNPGEPINCRCVARPVIDV